MWHDVEFWIHEFEGSIHPISWTVFGHLIRFVDSNSHLKWLGACLCVHAERLRRQREMILGEEIAKCIQLWPTLTSAEMAEWTDFELRIAFHVVQVFGASCVNSSLDGTLFVQPSC